MRPALLTRMSRPSRRVLTSSTKPWACSRSVTSTSSATARPPSASMRSTRSSSRSARRAPTPTATPARESASAVASPMPDEAPVIAATFPWRLSVATGADATPPAGSAAPTGARPRAARRGQAAWPRSRTADELHRQRQAGVVGAGGQRGGGVAGEVPHRGVADVGAAAVETCAAAPCPPTCPPLRAAGATTGVRTTSWSSKIALMRALVASRRAGPGAARARPAGGPGARACAVRGSSLSGASRAAASCATPCR